LSFFLNNYIITSKIQSDDQAKLQIIENYQQITNSAVPDIIFEIQNIENQVEPKIESYKINTNYKLDQFKNQKGSQKEIKKLYDSTRFKQDVFIPRYFENREYNGYFFYSNQDLQINQNYTLGWNVDSGALHLPNTQIIAKEMVYISV
jgi:hypothetical protein